jgi:hypothetical protein
MQNSGHDLGHKTEVLHMVAIASEEPAAVSLTTEAVTKALVCAGLLFYNAVSIETIYHQ